MASNLGPKVTSRTISWLSLAEQAWGSEFRAPDHDVYKFTGHSYDSTDRGTTGVYGVPGDNSIVLDNEQYPDLRDGLNMDFGPGKPNGSLNLPFGSFNELVPDTVFIPSGFASPKSDFDPYLSFVAMLLHGDSFTDAGPLATPITNGNGQVTSNSAIPPAFLGNQSCFYQQNVGSNNNIGNTGALWAGVLTPANEPWTFEMSLYCTAYPAGSASIMGCQLTSRSIVIGSTGKVDFSWGGVFNNILRGPLPLNQWTQIAVSYDGGIPNINNTGSIYSFVNGVFTASQANTNTVSGAADNFSFFELPGAMGGTGPVFLGGRKELRYTKNLQRYGQSGYTPRTTPFPNV